MIPTGTRYLLEAKSSKQTSTSFWWYNSRELTAHFSVSVFDVADTPASLLLANVTPITAYACQSVPAVIRLSNATIKPTGVVDPFSLSLFSHQQNASDYYTVELFTYENISSSSGFFHSTDGGVGPDWQYMYGSGGSASFEVQISLPSSSYRCTHLSTGTSPSQWYLCSYKPSSKMRFSLLNSSSSSNSWCYL